MHANADTRTLVQGLDVLSQSIDQKSASLKVLVESNFERFVRAKATIDNVYKEMKFRGADPSPPRGSRHSRHASRNSFRSSVAVGSPLAASVSDSRKKNALIKESEYGVMGIKAPLLDVSAKAEDVWGPALGGREKEEHLKTLSNQLQNFREYIELSSAVCDSIKRKDYESLVELYGRARSFADEGRRLSQELGGKTPDDTQLYQLVIAGRMWHDVDQQIQAFKKDIWKRLVSLHTLPGPEGLASRAQNQHMDMIGLLLELGVDDNPIWVWLLSRYDFFKGKIQATADRSKVEIELLRRRLANSEKPTPQAAASHLRSLGRQPVEGRHATSDAADVIELWEKMFAFVASLVSPQGILGDLVDFWHTAEGFIDGRAQRMLPLGHNGESQRHHQLPPKAIADLKKGVVELVDLLREHVLAFFAGMPPEDISLLFSPPPPMSPNSPADAGGRTPTALRDARFNLDPGDAPPPSPKRGEPWEKLAFWPPWSNSISGAHYLSKMLTLVGAGASDIAGIGPVASGDAHLVDSLKSLVAVSRERCVTALCAAWNRDAENIKYVEDWQRAPGSGDVTRMPAAFLSFEGALLSGMQQMLYMAGATERADGSSVVLPPPAKLLQMVRSQYVTTLYKALSGMVENAERSVRKGEGEWTAAEGDWRSSTPAPPVTGRSTLDAGDRVCCPRDALGLARGGPG